MSRFIEGEARTQGLLFPERLDDWTEADNPVRVIDAFVDELDVKELGVRWGGSCLAHRWIAPRERIHSEP